jgi:hypothetical protein
MKLNMIWSQSLSVAATANSASPPSVNLDHLPDTQKYFLLALLFLEMTAALASGSCCMDRFALGTIAQEQEVEDEQSTHTRFCTAYKRITFLISLLPFYSEGAQLNELIKNSHDDHNDPCHPTVQLCGEWTISS